MQSYRVDWHPERFKGNLNKILEQKLDESADVVKEEAKEKCPVKTGALRDSIDKEVYAEEQVAFIGSGLSYAGFVEYGTRKMSPRAYLRRGLDNSVHMIKAIFSKR